MKSIDLFASVVRRCACLFAVAFFAMQAVAADDAPRAADASPRATDASPRASDVSPRVFYLLTKTNPEDAPAPVSPLAREVYRQALLIAARDGAGLQTRDGSLREWGQAPPSDQAWNFIPDGAHLQIVDGAKAVIWREDRPNDAWPKNLPEAVERGEALSRGDFVQLLKAHGFSGKANVLKPGAAGPHDAKPRLADFNDLSQFAIIRETHDLIRADGESEARLGVLVRAYANLGQLTMFHWSIEHQVFAARSLLYAQRMVSNDPKSSIALWHRAYAMAMAGLQGQALKDVAAAKAIGADNAPSWTPLIEPFCHYDHTELNRLAAADSSHAPLALYLAFLTVEQSGSQVATLNTEQKAVTLNPSCLRLIDAMCNVTGPGMLNQLVEIGPMNFSSSLGIGLEKMPGMPKSVIQQIEELRRPEGNPQGRELICQALIGQGLPANDRTELSWAALGRDIQETTFAHIRRKADLIAIRWGVDASGFAAESAPLIHDHRFEGVIQAYGAMHAGGMDDAMNALKRVTWDDLTTTELPLYWLERMGGSRGDAGMRLLNNVFPRHMDFTSFDQEAWILFHTYALQGGYLQGTVNDLKAISPGSPWVTCYDIMNHWSADKAQEWEASAGGYPSVDMMLGTKYAQKARWADAERCLKRYIQISPDMAGYEALARLYWSQHQDDRWLKTLNDFLDNTQPIALEHAQVQVQIANYHMARGHFRAALPYADAAAQTASAWGLHCAARAHTGVGDFDQAEQSLIESYQHYGESPFDWYVWCVQTGHGRRGEASKAMHEYYEASTGRVAHEGLLLLSFIEGNAGNYADALGRLNRRYNADPGPVSYMHLLIFADESGDAASLREVLKAADQLPRENSSLMKFSKELVLTYQAGPDASLNLATIDDLLNNSDGADRIGIAVVTARYLKKHGHKDKAIEYLKKGYFGFDGYCSDLILLYQTSRDLGLDPLDLSHTREAPAK